MKRVAVIAAVLAIAACKGKEAPSMESIPKPAMAPAPADTGMKKMDSSMMKADTTKKDTGMKKGAMPPAPPAKKP